MNIFTELIDSFKPGSDGFLFMWVLALIAFLAFFLIVERWVDIGRRTNVNGAKLSDRIRDLIRENRFSEAYALCVTGKRRALPRILGAGIKKAEETPEMVRSAMEEETLHHIPILEKRLNLILMFGNVATLLGLMGTIFGLILSFDAVAQPGVDPIEKSSMLASGISTAMNTTLLGLMISVPCVLLYSIIKARIELSIQEIDRYAVSVLKVLMPAHVVQKDYKVSAKRIKEEVDTEPNIAPMMNLMVILIPLLLSSAEFVKIGAIELKLPESAQGGGEGGADEEKKDAKLDLGVVVTSKGFNLFHYFKEESKGQDEASVSQRAEIPLVNGEYDYKTLNKLLAEVKRKALKEIVGAARPVPDDATLIQLYTNYSQNDFSSVQTFSDHENVKIVAEDAIKYQVVVSVMDAARGANTPHGKVTMFPNVSIAGGIIQ